MEGLREAVPGHYRTWVRSAVLACVFGYSITAVSSSLSDTAPLILYRQELYALLISLSALLLERRNRPMQAAYLMLFAVAVEICVSFYRSPDGMQAAALLALPVVVLGAGLFLGPKWGYLLACAFSVLVPTLVHLGGKWGTGPGFDNNGWVYVTTILACVLGTAFILDIFLRSFGIVLSRARDNERRAADLLEASPDGLLVVSGIGNIEAMNDHAMEALGLSKTELRALVPEALPLASLDDSAATLDFQTLKKEAGPLEFRATKTGLALEARAREVRGKDGFASWLILLRDISSRLEAEEREQALATQLLHSQKLEAVGQLAGGVAHDFNNLLTVVAGYADFVEDMSDEGAEEVADELRETYQRGVVLTRQLLAFARRDVATPVPLDVAASLRGLEKLVRRLVGERVRVSIRCDGTCPIVADPGQLEQVVINLAANARDAMPEGGALFLSVESTADEVILRVRDCGAGIRPEVRERMFDPFFTTKPRGKGTGLGLSTVHGIVTQSGGHITVASVIDEGTTFELRWPRTTRELPQGGGFSKAQAPASGRGLVLLAEDDARARKLVLRVLSEAGFEVLVAQDGAEALSLALKLERSPDLLLTDVVMPGMSGVELIERVKRLHPNLRFLLMSGYTDHELEPHDFNLSEDLLQKPFGRDELLGRIAQKMAAPATI